MPPPKVFASTPSDLPAKIQPIREKTEQMGFTMPSDQWTGSLLRSLVASKPGGSFLELGTGLGLSLAWITAGMDQDSRVVSLDNDPELTAYASGLFATDERVTIETVDGERWIERYTGPPFDLIFADTWPGKYNHLEETLDLLGPGGIYVIDDMLEQPNWPPGHADKATALLTYLHNRKDFTLTALDWSTGVVIAVKNGSLLREMP